MLGGRALHPLFKEEQMRIGGKSLIFFLLSFSTFSFNGKQSNTQAYIGYVGWAGSADTMNPVLHFQKK